MSVGRSILVVVLVAAAGCASAPDEPPDDAGGTPPGDGAGQPRELGFELSACDALEVFLYTAPEDVRPNVPEVFDLVLQGGQARAILGVLVCGNPGNTTGRGFVAIHVSPTDDALRADGVVNYFWEPEHTLDAAHTSDAFWSLGADAVAAEVSLVFAPGSTTGRVDAANWTHTLEAPAGPVPAGDTADQLDRFREYAPADGGFVYLEAGFGGDAEAGLGGSVTTVRTGADTVAREIFGASASLPGVTLEDVEYTQARVGFVPWPPATS